MGVRVPPSAPWCICSFAVDSPLGIFAHRNRLFRLRNGTEGGARNIIIQIWMQRAKDRALEPGTVVLTGCAGFIGCKVAELLLQAGHLVIGIDNLNDAYDVRLKRWRLERILHHPGFQFHRLDIGDRAALSALFEGACGTPGNRPAAIINLAARAGVRQSVEDPWVYYDTNVTGTLNLLDLCRTHGINKFVLSSTSSLYGQGNHLPYREDANTDAPLSPYAASKKAAEALCYTYHYLYGIDMTILRYFTVYGPAGRPDMSLFRFVQWISEEHPVMVYGDGRQSRDFTFVDDIARGTIAGLKPLGFETINLGSDTPIVLMDAVRLVEELVGKRAEIVHAARHPADVQATWAEISKAKRLLGWQPQSTFQDGVGALVRWYQPTASGRGMYQQGNVRLMPWSDRLLSWTLTLLLLFTPLAFGTVEVWSIAVAELLVLVMGAIWFAQMIRDGRIQIDRTPFTVLILSFLALMLVQMLPLPLNTIKLLSPAAYSVYSVAASALNLQVEWRTISLDPVATREELLRVLTYAMLFWILLNRFREREQVERVIVTIIGVGFFLAVFAIIHKYSSNGKLYWIRETAQGGEPFGPYVNRNHFAGYMEIALPLTIGYILAQSPLRAARLAMRERLLLWTSQSTSKSILLLFAAIFMGAALILTGSRGGLVSFAGSMVFFVMMAIMKRTARSRTVRLALACCGLTLIARSGSVETAHSCRWSGSRRRSRSHPQKSEPSYGGIPGAWRTITCVLAPGSTPSRGCSRRTRHLPLR